MATYGDLKTRIIGEMVRDDLAAGEENEAQLINAIQDAIDEYKGRDWWFLNTTITAPTVAAQNYIARPAGIEMIERMSIPALGFDLERKDITELEMLDEPTVQTGQPQYYAETELGGRLRLWPVPNAIYTVKFTGTALIPDLSDDADSNVWTNVAKRLIRARAKAELWRFFVDPAREGSAMREEALALSSLDLVNTNRVSARVKGSW